MRSPEIERLFRKVRAARVTAFVGALLLLAFSASASRLLIFTLSEKYLLYYPVLSWLVMGAVFFAILIRALAALLAANDRKAAMLIDQEHQLKNRLTTYVQFRDTDSGFIEALAAETRPKLRTVRIWRATAVFRLLYAPAILAATLAALLLVSPYLPVPEAVAARKQEREQVREQARQLKRFLQQKQQKADPNLKKLLREMEMELKALDQPEVDKVEALKKLNRLEERLKHAEIQASKEEARRLLNKQSELSGKARQDQQEASREDMEKLMKEMEDALGSKDLEAAQSERGTKSLRRPMQKLSEKDLQNMKKALEEYKKRRAEREKELAQLKDALERSRQGMTSDSRGRKVVADSRIKDRDVEKSKGGVEDGPGTTNQDIGPQSFDTRKQKPGEYVEDRTKSEYEQLYEGQRTKSGKDPLYLENEWDPDAETRYMRIRSFGLPSESSAAPGASVSAPQNADESEIRKERIPAAYQKIVSDYFKGIEE